MEGYTPSKIEEKWVGIWEKERLFYGEEGLADGPKKYLLVEFPYPSGEGLHLGHAFTCTILDVLARKKRREGFNVLYPMGWDAFGLPTENYAIRTGVHPAAATKKNTDRFREQMKRLGFAYNWGREINTTDPSYYKWTQWIFLKFFKAGLAYKAETPVGWCPSCKIILANEEMVGGKCERCGETCEYRMQKQWLLAITKYADRLASDLNLVDYPDYVKTSQRSWIGKSEGITIDYPLIIKTQNSKLKAQNHKLKVKSDGNADFISCYSTRPDTNFGTTFIVVAPEHPRLAELTTPENKEAVEKYVYEAKRRSELERTELSKEKIGVFTGSYALNRLSRRKMPIWVADFAVLTSGTGMVVGVPAHDQRDFDFANKYHLDIVPVIKPKDRDWDYNKAPYLDIDEAVVFNSDFLNGLPAKEAIEKIIGYLVKKGWGKRAVNYHLRDWVFSRQHYWGEPIPMIYCPNCARKGKSWVDSREAEEFVEQNFEFLISNFESISNDLMFKNSEIENSFKIQNLKLKIRAQFKEMAGWWPVDEAELPVELPAVEKYQPTDTGESPLSKIESFAKTKCPACGSFARRETDTMPNWAGSSWYYLAYVLKHKLGTQNSKLKTPAFAKASVGRQNYNLKVKSGEEGNQSIFEMGKAELDHWMPVDLYLGGAEHTTLHLLYSRFWHKFLFDLGVVPEEEPYQSRRQHGVILGEDGNRMSKSRGNVINPDEMVKRFGADTLRCYLMFMGPYDSTMPWSTKGMIGVYRFLEKVWRMGMEVLENPKYQVPSTQKAPSTKYQIAGSGIVGGMGDIEARLINKLVKKVGEDIENLKFNTAIASMMEFIGPFLRKKSPDAKETVVNFRGQSPTPIGISSEESKVAGRVLDVETFKKFLLVLAPFAPFMTEEIWQKISAKRNPFGKLRASAQSAKLEVQNRSWRREEFRSIHEEGWPEYDRRALVEETVTIVVEVNGKTRGKCEVQSAECKAQGKVEVLAKEEEGVLRHLEGKKIKRVVFVPGRLINFVVE